MTRLGFIEAHAAGAFGDLSDEGMKLLDKAVKGIRIESAWGPTTRINDPFSSSPTPGVGSKLGAILKPKITLEMRAGWGKDRSIAPYGNPGPSKFPFVVLGAVALAVLAAGGTRLLRR